MASAGSKVSAAALTIDELAEYYQRYPISEAAQELGVGLTALKRRCREVGILRWPYRQLQSLDIMIKQLSDMDCVDAQRAADLARTEKFLLVHDPSRKMPETLRKLRQAQFKEKFTMVRMITNYRGEVDDGADGDDADEADGGEGAEEEGLATVSSDEARKAREARAARRERSRKRGADEMGADIDEEPGADDVEQQATAGGAAGGVAPAVPVGGARPTWEAGGDLFFSSWLTAADPAANKPGVASAGCSGAQDGGDGR